ncbi:hypothetical protein Tco_1351815 [Tanacetum coccineum]
MGLLTPSDIQHSRRYSGFVGVTDCTRAKQSLVFCFISCTYTAVYTTLKPGRAFGEPMMRRYLRERYMEIDDDGDSSGRWTLMRMRTEPVIPPPSIDITIGARITVRPQTSISLHRGQSSTCTFISSIVPNQPLITIIGCPTLTQTLRIASTQALIDAVTAALPSPSLPPLPPSLYIPPPVDHRDDILNSTARTIRGQGIDYGFVSTVDAEERR